MRCLRNSLLIPALLTGLGSTLAFEVPFPEYPPAGSALVVLDNFIGISFELSSFDTLWGSTPDAIPSAIKNYLHNIIDRMSQPLRIRVGGNGMDGSTYVPTMTDKMLELVDPDAYFNDIPVNFGPLLFDVMNAMYDKVGAMQFMVGLSMRDPSKDQNVLDLATAAEKRLGSRLDSLLLGNEADLYAGHGERDQYNISTYIPEVGSVIDDMKKQGLLESPLIGGPSICCSWDLSDVIEAGLDKFDYKYYTLQHYPNHACQGETEKNTNISYYLTHTNMDSFVNWNQKGINLAVEEHVPVLLTEYNSVACGGSNVSETFATSLWAIDAGMKAGSNNFSAVYLHTREYGVKYNLFEPITEGDSASIHWRTGPVYYSTLFLTEAIHNLGSTFVDLDLNSSNTNPEATIAGYAIYDNDGKERGKLALFNYAREGAEPQAFDIPAGLTDTVHYRVLTAPSVYEKTEITWAGQTVRENGQLEGKQVIESMACAGGCTIHVPSPGAALVLVGSDGTFYEGNSTVADWFGTAVSFDNGNGVASLGQTYGIVFSLAFAFVAYFA